MLAGGFYFYILFNFFFLLNVILLIYIWTPCISQQLNNTSLITLCIMYGVLKQIITRVNRYMLTNVPNRTNNKRDESGYSIPQGLIWFKLIS